MSLESRLAECHFPKRHLLVKEGEFARAAFFIEKLQGYGDFVYFCLIAEKGREKSKTDSRCFR